VVVGDKRFILDQPGASGCGKMRISILDHLRIVSSKKADKETNGMKIHLT
jgi:hypothetical protein